MPDRLSSLITSWTLIDQAHAESSEKAASARNVLAERYCGAVYRYLLGVVRTPEAADELTQEFGLLLIGKKFHRANPDRGRFRDYLKMVLRHLVHRHMKEKDKQPRYASEMELLNDATAQTADEEFDRAFAESWRQQLLARTWEALRESNSEYYTLLRFRVDHTDLNSGQMAEPLSDKLGRSLTADNVRQLLRRARQRFGDLLLEDVACSLEQPDIDTLKVELHDLKLLDYCADALQRFRKS